MALLALVGSFGFVGACSPSLSVEEACEEAYSLAGEGYGFLNSGLSSFNGDNWGVLNSAGDNVLGVSADLDALAIGDAELSEVVGEMSSSLQTAGEAYARVNSDEDLVDLIGISLPIMESLNELGVLCDGVLED